MTFWEWGRMRSLVVMRSYHAVDLMLCILAIAGCVYCAGAHAQDPIQTTLPYVSDGLALQVPINVEGREVRFKKEPRFGLHEIVRAPIPLGESRENFIGFAWDKSDHVLYVDYNRNLDLTDDDPVSAASAPGDVPGECFNVKLAVPHGALTVEYALTLRLWQGAWSYAVVTSGWRGPVSLGGVDYELSIIDNLDGALGTGDSLQLRRLEDSPLAPTAADLLRLVQVEAYGIPAYVAFSDTVYAVQTAFEPTPDATTVQVRFSAPNLPVGTMKIGGSNIAEIVFLREHDVVQAYPDASHIRVPLGTYSTRRLLLDDGWMLDDTRRAPVVTVTQNTAAVLAAGGPLMHKISATPSGNTLMLTYATEGLNGAAYRKQAAEGPPKFAVYRGDTKVGAGQFEYG